MKTYICTFDGQEKGAIGSTHPVTEEVQAENRNRVHVKLHEKYELILHLKINGKDHDISYEDYLTACKMK